VHLPDAHSVSVVHDVRQAPFVHLYAPHETGANPGRHAPSVEHCGATTPRPSAVHVPAPHGLPAGAALQVTVALAHV
jgi:hypothetical protein